MLPCLGVVVIAFLMGFAAAHEAAERDRIENHSLEGGMTRIRKLKDEHSHGGSRYTKGTAPAGIGYSLTAGEALLLATALQAAAQDVLRGNMNDPAAKRWRVWVLPSDDKPKERNTGRFQIHAGDY